MSQEELDKSVREHVRAHFVPKKPPPVHQWSEADKKYFRSLLQLKYRAPLSDYDRQITKSWEKPSNHRRNQVPQLGQQSKQSIPPLKVLSVKDAATAQFVLESGLTKAQLLEEAPIEVHPGSNKKPFVLGEPLMWEELIPTLPTRMRELHAWYMKASASKDVVFRARIQDRHFHWGLDDIWIYFENLYDLYHQDALDKSLLCVFCM